MRLRVDDGRYACRYPQERPRDGVNVDIWGENGDYLGVGVGSARRSCGGVIVVKGKTYDCNDIVNWLPADEGATS